MIMFNKAILSSMNFPYPMFLVTWHMGFATVMTQLLSRYTDMLPGVKQQKVDLAIYKRQVLPVSLCMAVSLVLGNKAYIFLSVSYIQMLKAFTPVLVLLLSFLTGLEKSSVVEMNIVAIISMGVALTSVGELMFSMTGFTLQVLALVSESVRLVMVNLFLKQLGLDALSTLYYIAPLCASTVGLACAVFEFWDLPFAMMETPYFWGIMLANGILAFSLNITSVLLIKHTSALTLTLAGILKDIMLVALSIAIFGSPVSLVQYLGYSVSLLALNLHKDFKKNRSVLEAQQQQTLPTTAAESAAAIPTPAAAVAATATRKDASGGSA